MKRRYDYWLLALGILFLAGCGGSNKRARGNTSTFNGLEYLVLNGNVQPSNGGVTGTGNIIFRTTVQEDNNFIVAFNLLEKGSAITLSTNTDSKLDKGINFSLSRDPDNALKVTFTVGAESYDLSSDFEGVPADQPLTLDIDVHGHGHVIAVIRDIEKEYAFTTRVIGTAWGLIFKNATITNVKVDKAKKGHAKKAK